MSDNATIISGIQYAQEIFKQVSILLLTAGEVVSENEFELHSGSTSVVGYSAKVTEPSKWLANTVFRFYRSGRSPRVLLFVSVLFYDRKQDFKCPMGECLLTAGAFIHKGKAWDDKWAQWWWARWHGFREARRDDGSVMCIERRDQWQEDERKMIERDFTIGVPLPSVRNSEELKAFLTPLFKVLESYRTGAAEGATETE